MYWDDEYDNGYDGTNYSEQDGSMPDKDSEGGLDPMNIANPAISYFFLSDDAQEEIGGWKRKR